MASRYPSRQASYAFEVDGNTRLFDRALFVLLLLLTAFVPAGVATGFYVGIFFVYFISIKAGIRRGLILLGSPFLAMFAMGLLFAQQHQFSDVMRDVWYLWKILFTLGAGYYLMCRLKSLRVMFKLVIVAATILAAYHLFNVIFILQGSQSIMDLREEAGGGYFVTVIGLGFLLGVANSRRYIGIRKPLYYFTILLCAGSLIASGSRTNIISFASMVFVMRGWGRLNSKTVLRLAAFGAALMLLGLVGAINSFSVNKNDENKVSLASKFAHSVTEIAISNYDSMRDINANWRGFESYRAYLAFLEGGLPEQIFGQGLGATVDLGFYMPLAGAEYRYIPVLHNGYMYVLVKYGLLGLLAYLWFIVGLIRVDFRGFAHQSFDLDLSGRFVRSLGWALLFSSLVVAGLFNKSTFDSSAVILGAVFSWIRMRNRLPNLSYRQNKFDTR